MYRPMEFNSDGLVDIYLAHIMFMNGIMEKNPDGYHRMMSDIYNQAACVIFSLKLPARITNDNCFSDIGVSSSTTVANQIMATLDIDNMDV
jgi:hypothetical protein